MDQQINDDIDTLAGHEALLESSLREYLTAKASAYDAVARFVGREITNQEFNEIVEAMHFAKARLNECRRRLEGFIRDHPR